MDNFYLFVASVIFLILLPGPDFAIITRNTLALGRTAGVATVLGTCCALLVHTSAAVVGLSAIIMKSALLFSVIKYVGALYLLCLGVKTFWRLKNKKEPSVDETEAEAEVAAEAEYNGRSNFKQGFLTNILNPKVAIFFLTFMPQFVEPGSSPFQSFLIMGITYTLLTAAWFIFYVNFLSRISAFMKSPRTQSAIEGITGVILIGFGIKLALEKV